MPRREAGVLPRAGRRPRRPRAARGERARVRPLPSSSSCSTRGLGIVQAAAARVPRRRRRPRGDPTARAAGPATRPPRRRPVSRRRTRSRGWASTRGTTCCASLPASTRRRGRPRCRPPRRSRCWATRPASTSNSAPSRAQTGSRRWSPRSSCTPLPTWTSTWTRPGRALFEHPERPVVGEALAQLAALPPSGRPRSRPECVVSDGEFGLAGASCLCPRAVSSVGRAG